MNCQKKSEWMSEIDSNRNFQEIGIDGEMATRGKTITNKINGMLKPFLKIKSYTQTSAARGPILVGTVPTFIFLWDKYVAQGPPRTWHCSGSRA